eukprot:scaffold232072_cov50-Attheya_sp.AAC.1
MATGEQGFVHYWTFVPTCHIYPVDAFDSEIPFMLLYLPAHIRCLSPESISPSLDRTSLPSDWRCHDEQADYLCGL